MALRHLLLRFSPTFGRGWLVVLAVLAVAGLAATLVRWTTPPPPLDLVALGPDGRFQDTLLIPSEWADTATTTPDGVVRVPLMLAARNLGRSAVRPERLSLSVPLRYRLTGTAGEELEARVESGSPLLTYTLRPELGPVEPERLPAMLPAHDTIWLEVVSPAYYCVAVADSIPEFVPAPPPPVHTMAEVRIFYSFEGGDLGHRRTGTLTVRMDTSLLAMDPPEAPPTFDMVNDPALAQPELDALLLVGSRRTECGEPGSAMTLLSTVWETPAGGRFITLDYGGTVRKHLYDLDGDGVIERESWAGGHEDQFTATRRTALPIPEFLLPITSSGAYDMARIDSLPPDSVVRLDPFRRAMQGPGAVPGGLAGPGADSVRRAEAARAGVPPDSLPEPRVAPVGPIGRPVQIDTIGS